MALQVVDLTKYDQSKYNVLVPTAKLEQISPFHALRVEEVRINPDPAGGDIYKVGSREIGNRSEDLYGLTKTAILRLANAAGIVWNWADTKVLQASRDYVLYQAVGAVRKPSGEWIPVKATKEIDLAVVEEELRDQFEKKAAKEKKDKAWVELQVRANLIQWRKNKLMRAETGAMLRVVRALLSLKHQYTIEELKKPFIVPRVDFSPDYRDPEVRKMVLEAGVKAASELFSQMTPQRAALPPGEPVDYEVYRRQTRQAVEEEIEPVVIEPEIDEDQLVLPVDQATQDANEAGQPSDTGAQQQKTEEAKAEEQKQPEPAGAGGGTPIVTELACSQCGKELSQNVFTYSVKKFGQPLCYKCQQQARKGAAK
ncbi:MAG: hypothetical protein HPY55_16075 [Firmicutes bacterium]|nr:hypothetical protein [Bacillota bacterium]